MTLTPEGHVSAELKRWRDRRNLSAAELATRVATYGGKLSRQAISKIENGERGVSLDEVLQLALALTVPAPLLFMPLDGSELLEISPGVKVHPEDAWEWMAGEMSIVSGDGINHLLEWNEAVRSVNLHKQLFAAQAEWSEASRLFRVASASGSQPRVSAARERQVDALRAMADALNALARDGLLVRRRKDFPRSRFWWGVDEMLELGLLDQPEMFTTDPAGSVDGR